MTAAAPTGATAFADELRAVAPEVADAFDAAFVELMDQALPAWDDRLAELLAVPHEAAGEVAAGGKVVAFARSPRRLARRAVVVGGAVTVVVAATTGLAAASVLPGPVQRAVAEVASHVGIGLPTPSADATPSLVVASTNAPATTTTVAPTTAPPPTAAAAPATPPGTARAGTTASPPSPAATTPTPDRAGFLAAVAAFRACLAAERGTRDCTPPDPAAFGVASSVEPADVSAFRAAYAAYRACLRAARSSEGRAACGRPDPASYGLGRPAPPTAPPTGTAPSAAATEALRKALVAYGTCLTAAHTPAELRLCSPPNPYDFGLSAWPPGLVLPHRPSATSRPAASSPPVDARPPARTPGATGSSESWTGSRPRR